MWGWGLRGGMRRGIDRLPAYLLFFLGEAGRAGREGDAIRYDQMR